MLYTIVDYVSMLVVKLVFGKLDGSSTCLNIAVPEEHRGQVRLDEITNLNRRN